MPGAVPGLGDEAVNEAGRVPAPKGQKTDKQVITVQHDETDNLLAPGQATELGGWGTALGESEEAFPYPGL